MRGLGLGFGFAGSGAGLTLGRLTGGFLGEGFFPPTSSPGVINLTLYGFVFEPFDTFLDAGFFICAISLGLFRYASLLHDGQLLLHVMLCVGGH